MNKNELILSLGSNLGNRFENLKSAINLINKEIFFDNRSICSSIYQTKALLPPNSPPEWNLDYFNMCIRGTSSLNHLTILERIKKIESILGRDLDAPRWSPRIIDIDILAYGELFLQTSQINIPHHELFNRNWCLVPFAEIYPDWICNIKNSFYHKTINDIIKLIDISNVDDLIKTELNINA